MNWNNYISMLMVLCLGAGCNKPVKDAGAKLPVVSKYLIEADELRSIIDQDSLILLDLQRPEDFNKGHLPNAINLWRSALNNPSFKYDGMMPEREMLEAVLQNKGVSPDAFLVLYDNRGSCEATRLWWILKHYGYDRMAILNGGTQAWSQVDSLTSVTTVKPQGNFKFPEYAKAPTSDNILVTDLSKMIDQNQVVVLDTRSKEEYEGLTLKQGAQWAGRIPGSIHIDWMEAVDQSTYRFKEPTELQNIYNKMLNNDLLAVTYCHSGVRSTHTYFVLTELLGRKNVTNYDGSWVEWTNHFQQELVN
ncbi:sulfurtransferase [Ekhidna sp.]|uniref:sulfurtransferase n=1 Tax=Ekhidna sp. TaxID=2608089 RepID=UPI0032EBA145